MGRGTGSAHADSVTPAQRGAEQTRARTRRPTAEEVLDANYEAYRAKHVDRVLLTDTAAVADLVARLKARRIPSVEFDMETERGLADQWGVKNGAVRLMQIGVKGQQTGQRRQWLIDCQRADPTPVKALLTDRNVEKIIFYSPFEQEWSKAALGCTIQNVTDPCLEFQSIQKELKKLLEREGPQAVDQLLPGWREKELGGLAHWVQRVHHMRLPKDFQDSDWGVDPLSEGQLDYAAMDVAVMTEIADLTRSLCQRLGIVGRMRYRYRVTKEEIRDQVAGLIDGDDGSRDVCWPLVYAADADELDDAWARVERHGVMPVNHQQMRAFYEARRVELAGGLDHRAERAAFQQLIASQADDEDYIAEMMRRFDRLRPAPFDLSAGDPLPDDVREALDEHLATPPDQRYTQR